MARAAPDSPHDRLFKLTFSVTENAIVELRAILPRALLDRVDLSSLQVVSGEFVDEALKSSHSDLLYSVQISGRPGYVYVLFEHQSTEDALLPLRLMRYVVRVLERHARERNDTDDVARTAPRPPLPVVIPVVLHHGEGRWTRPTRFEDMFDPELAAIPEVHALIPRLGFVLDDLSTLTDAALKERALSLSATLALWAMRDARSPTRLLRALGTWAGALVELLRAPSGREAVEALFRYIGSVADIPYDEFAERVIEAAPEIEDAVMTIAEQLEARGRAKGRAEGRVEGRVEGRAEGRVEGRAEGQVQGRQDVLLQLLQLKFGAVSDATQARVAGASEAELTRWTERILSAASVEEVFG